MAEGFVRCLWPFIHHIEAKARMAVWRDPLFSSHRELLFRWWAASSAASVAPRTFLLSPVRHFTSCSASIAARWAVHSRLRCLIVAVRIPSLCSADNLSVRLTATSIVSVPIPRPRLRYCRRRWSCSHSTWSSCGKEKLINIEQSNNNDIGSVWVSSHFQWLQNH